MSVKVTGLERGLYFCTTFLLLRANTLNQSERVVQSELRVWRLHLHTFKWCIYLILVCLENIQYFLLLFWVTSLVLLVTFL